MSEHFKFLYQTYLELTSVLVRDLTYGRDIGRFELKLLAQNRLAKLDEQSDLQEDLPID